LSELKRLKIWSSGKSLSAPIKSMPAFQQITKLSGLIRQDDLHSKVINKEILASISSLSETSLSPAQSQFLISLPNQGAWSIGGLRWHTDISASSHRGLTGIQAFILIDEVMPRGGATMAIAGSHLLAGQEEASRKIRDILRREGDLEGELGRHDLSIVEMFGHAGDVYLMDMRLLHTPSFNATSKVRIMATVRYLPVTHGWA
jgi:ectoine hydroxylase-related dioxygenase (phytanoyl-CoA dioxygenase family)